MTPLPSPPAKASRTRLQFIVASLAMGALVAMVGWLSDLRAVFHGTIIVFSVAAFLPLLVALTIVLAFLGMSAIAVLSGASDSAPTAADAFATSEGLAAFFRRVLVPYYRFLFSRRHPVLLGSACGFLLGTLLVWALLSAVVLPGEVCTLKRMAAIQSAIDSRLASFPSPLHDQWIDRTVLDKRWTAGPSARPPHEQHKEAS